MRTARYSSRPPSRAGSEPKPASARPMCRAVCLDDAMRTPFYLMGITVAILSPLFSTRSMVHAVRKDGALTLDAVKRAPTRVVLENGAPAPHTLRVERKWDGPICLARLVNTGKDPAH